MLKLFSAICLVLAALWPQAALAQSGTYAPNTVLAGPPSGSSRGFPVPRSLVGLDLPTPTASTLGGVNSFTCASHQWVSSLSIAGAFACTQPATSDLSGASALTAANDTNVTLTLGGTPATALLAGASITAGWTGTLAAGRLNSNVVQGITNDTNITGTITAQNLTLGWTGTLAVGRGGTGLATGTSGGILGFTGATTLASSGLLTQNGVVIGGGAGVTPSSTAAGTNGQIFLGVTSGAPGWGTMSNDCTITNAGVITCLKVNGVALAAPGSATTDTTNASNISSGTLSSARFSAIKSINVQQFQTSATYTASANLLFDKVTCVGGGGGGGGTPTTTATQVAAGGGGAAGGTGFGIFSGATIGASQTVTIGAAGTHVAGSAGGNGGNTTFGALMTSNGGQGGPLGVVSTSSIIVGGAGGGSATGGYFGILGQAGWDGWGSTGGGLVQGGSGGSSLLGGGGTVAMSGSGAGQAQAGNGAVGFGSGGSGAAAGNSSASTLAGGAATAGICIVEEFIGP